MKAKEVRLVIEMKDNKEIDKVLKEHPDTVVFVTPGGKVLTTALGVLERDNEITKLKRKNEKLLEEVKELNTKYRFLEKEFDKNLLELERKENVIFKANGAIDEFIQERELLENKVKWFTDLVKELAGVKTIKDKTEEE